MAKRIVISGVTRGLGRALVPHFIQVRHTVFGCGRNAPMIDDLAKKYPAPNSFQALDVRCADRLREWADEVTRQHGPPDLVIANAALMNTPHKLWDVPAAEFDALIDVNIKGVANLIRAFAPAMVAKKHGVFVALSSGWGRSTSPDVAPYCASKYAVEGLMLALAQELPAGMASIPLNPGVIDTDMLRQCMKDKAHLYPKPDAWARRAAPFLLNLCAKENGKSLTVPS